MVNCLKMKKRQQVIALLELGWTHRRIESETGVRRETISEGWMTEAAGRGCSDLPLPCQASRGVI